MRRTPRSLTHRYPLAMRTIAKMRLAENRPEIALSRSVVDARFRFGGVQVEHPEPHRFADDGLRNRHPTLAVVLHPAESLGDQESRLEVRVGDVVTDVRVCEVILAAGRRRGARGRGRLCRGARRRPSWPSWPSWASGRAASGCMRRPA